MSKSPLIKGSYVVMHSCHEAERHNGRVWKCRSGEQKYEGRSVVFLEDYPGPFYIQYLQKVDIGTFMFKSGKKQ